MDYFAICGLVAFLSGIFCSFIVLFHRPHSALKIFWSAFSLGVSGWGFGSLFLFTTHDPMKALFWSRFLNIISLSIPIFLLVFVLLLTNRFKRYQHMVTVMAGLIVLYAVGCLCNLHYFIPLVNAQLGFEWYPRAGWLYYPFPIYFILLIGLALWELMKSSQGASTITRNQYRYVFFFILFGAIGGLSTMFYLFNIPFYPIFIIFVPVMNVGMGYVILKHQLMDIQVVINRSFAYTLLLSVFMVVYLIICWLIERFFAQVIGYHSWVSSLTAVLVIAFSFIPLRNFLQETLEKIFFRASFGQILEQNDLLRQQVLRSDRYRTLAELSQRIIDELRNPLTALIGYGHLFNKHAHEPEFLHKFAGMYQRELSRIQQLVNQLSEFAEQKPLEFKELDLKDLVSEIVNIVKDQCEAKKINLIEQMPEGSSNVSVDEKQLKQAIFYFLTWSIKSTPLGGQVMVMIEKRLENMELVIKDTGSGLTQEQKMRIFDPYLSPDADGGFGQVAKAQAIIFAHGGKVMIESQRGVGTEWIIQLPSTY